MASFYLINQHVLPHYMPYYRNNLSGHGVQSKTRLLSKLHKTLLTSSCILTHYDPFKPLVLACNTSPYGIGAVLSHKIGDEECPIAYAFHSLAPAENYLQINKEALVFGVRHFHKYLHGHFFTIKSDHKPLQHLFEKGRGFSEMASA